MKKVVLALLMATLLAGGAFAQLQLSAGAGLLIVPAIGEKSYDGEKKGSTEGVMIGGNVFFDITYAEVNIGILGGNFKQKDKDGKVADGDKGTDVTDLTLGLVGKYPFALGDKVKLFPFLGIEYNINLSTKSDGEDVFKDGKYGVDKDGNDYSKADVTSSLKLLIGVGVDFDLTDSIYLRGEVGYGYDFLSKQMNDQIKDDSKNKIINSIIPIKLAVGFKF